MAAVTGAWRSRYSGGEVAYATALNEGTGVNPIHRLRAGQGRNIAPGVALGTIGAGMTDDYDPGLSDDYAYDDVNCYDGVDNETFTVWGHGYETGTRDRPQLGDTDFRQSTGDFPPYGNYQSGLPGGTVIRTLDHGGDINDLAKVQPEENASQGWVNKSHDGGVVDSVTSDVSQYEMQTSMTQRDKTRAGSQSSGTANEFDAPISSRVVGMRTKVYASPDSARHDEMMPKSQDEIIRPFWLRTAGTGYREWMAPNEMYRSEPKMRTPPPDASQGIDTPVTEDNWVDEDYTW